MAESTFISIKWQDGPPDEGVNGANLQDVLKIVLTQLEGRLQSKATNSREDALARNKVEEAILWLNEKESKIKRGGTNGHAYSDKAHHRSNHP